MANGQTTEGDAQPARSRGDEEEASSEVFSCEAVKANARERVGQPKPERVLPSEGHESRRERKHKETLALLLAGRE